MKGLMAAILSLGLLAVAAPVKAQTSSTPDKNPQAEGVARIGAGIVIPAELTKSLDSKKLKEGDPVNAKVSQDLLSGGKIAVPRDSKIVGHVTEAKARDKGASESTLGIAFDRLILKSGQQYQLNAVLQAVGPPIMYTPSDMGPGGPNANSGPPYGGMPNPHAPGSAPNSNTNAPTTGNAPQPLPTNATGVVGISGLTLRDTSSASSVLVSDKKNVKLDSGSQLLLRTANP